MTANSLVTARIDTLIKEKTSIVLASSVLVPNKITIKAIDESRKNKLSRFDNINELLDDLKEKD